MLIFVALWETAPASACHSKSAATKSNATQVALNREDDPWLTVANRRLDLIHKTGSVISPDWE